MFTVTVFGIFLFDVRWVLCPAQRYTGSERTIRKTQYNNGWSILSAIHMTVLSTIKKGMSNLAYFDKIITLFKTKTKLPVQSLQK